MIATDSRVRWGRFLIALAAVAALMGLAIINASPADAHHWQGGGSSTTTSGPCVPSQGQEYIAPTIVHHDQVTHIEYKYKKWTGNHWTYKNFDDSGYHFGWTYVGPVVVVDSEAWDEVVDPGQPYIAPVVCETTTTTTGTTTTTSSTTTTTSSTTTTTTTTTSPPVDVCSNIDGDQATVPDGYLLIEGECLQDVTLDVSSTDTPTPTLTEVVLAATGAERSSGSAALALALVLGGLGAMLLRRPVKAEI
jgi:hypothetical protein